MPGWRELAGKAVVEIVCEQWLRTTSILLDDLEGLPPGRWCVVDHTALLRDPRAELERLCAFVGIEADERVSAPMPLLRDARATAKRSAVEPCPELEARLPRTEEAAERPASGWRSRASPSVPPPLPPTRRCEASTRAPFLPCSSSFEARC